jgi:hypothetical protein
MFGPKKEEVTRHWIMLYNVEYNNSHSSQVDEDEIGGGCSIHREGGMYTTLQ